MAKSKKATAPSRKTSKLNNQAPVRRQVKVRVGEPWHVEVVRIRAKTQARIATFLAVSLVLLLAACAVRAWMAGDHEQINFITQFVSHGLAIAIGWAFGTTRRDNKRP